jgi:hypothetical protein
MSMNVVFGRWLSRFVAACLAALLVTACDAGRDDIRIFNSTDMTVVVNANYGGEEREFATLPPNQATYPKVQCIQGELIARDLEGNEIDRHPPGFCRGDPEWLIGDPDT